MFKEFKEFAVRGNVVDMATGIIIGGAFGTIVKSLVDDVIMPPIGLLLGGVWIFPISLLFLRTAQQHPDHTLPWPTPRPQGPSPSTTDYFSIQ